MVSVSDNLRKCGVKISTVVSGVPTTGSGVVYETPNDCKYNYVLTAKHIFQEDSPTPYNIEKLSHIEVLYSEKKTFKRLQYIKQTEIKDRLIIFEEDFAIIIIDKNKNVNFRQIVVSDDIEGDDVEFFSWATFSANEDELHFFDFKRNDHENRRIKMNNPPSWEKLSGISGAGVFVKGKHILYGIICRYPNDEFENETIDCTCIKFEDINIKLKSLDKILLDTKDSQYKKEVNNVVVDIKQATINDVCLNLELARQRLKTDLVDDWFHDPLRYIDLLKQNYLFKQFSSYFNNNSYEAAQAEHFYVPKKKLTLRQALVSPFVDRIMYMAVVGVLAEKMDQSMIPSVYSARYNKFSKHQLILNGVEQWKKMKYILAKKAQEKIGADYKYGCIIEIDLLNFYDNINKKLLIEKIKRVCETENEKKACDLLNQILKNLSERELGLPQNSDASSLLASFYLNQVDIFMQNNTFSYFRFMDDIRIFCRDKYEARRILQMFEFELRRCDLSVNSQKTEIRTIIETSATSVDSVCRKDFSDSLFDLELSKIARLRKSENYAYLNQAFHQSVTLLEDNIQEDLNGSEDNAKQLNYALNTLELLGKKSVHLYSGTKFLEKILSVTKSLYDKPWLTTQVCKVLNLMVSDKISNDFLQVLTEIITDEKYNTYAFQTYQIWLLLAKHKYKSEELVRYATSHIEKNDETNRPVIAAMIIYVCSVNEGYKRIILRKFGQGFTHGYFQNRIALIALRSFDANLIQEKKIDPSLKNAPEFTSEYRNKDLVYIQGESEYADEENSDLEQLYSL